jgi:hypothetical protein
MKFLFFICLVFLAEVVFSQSINWQKAHHWKIYDMRDQKGLRVPVDSLFNFRSINLGDDTIYYFLRDAELWPPEKYSLWMGEFVVSFEDDQGILRKVDISMYAGFFFDELTKRYYQIKDAERRDWLDFFNYQSGKFSIGYVK